MYITRFLIICLMLVASQVQAQSNRKSKVSTWQEALVELRAKIEAGEVVGKKPMYSDIMRHKMPAQKMVFDVKGVEDLIITTHGTVDGTGWDHAVFAAPRLTGIDGKVIYLHDLKHTFAKAPYETPKFDVHFSGKKIALGGKEYERGILLHSNGTMTYKLGKKYTKLEVEVGIDDKSSSGSAIFKIQDARFNEQKLLGALTPEQQKGIMDFVILTKTPLDLLLSKSDGSIEKSTIESIMLPYKDKTFFQQKMAEYDKLPSSKKVLNYIDLALLANKVKQFNEQMAWVNPKAMALYLEDMKSNKKFDYPKYKALYDKLVRQLDETKSELLKGNVEYVAKGEEILELRDQIILANPLLDPDKIVVARFKMGGAARSAMGTAIGTAAANYSSMFSSPRKGFNAEVAELSNLRGGDVKVRTIYKPKNGENIADLQMHWDANKLLFTSVNEKNRWNIYEVNIDGTDFHEKINLEDEDVEFCDANYLPDGRIVTASNVGYNGVPCVSGSDEVGNLSLYNPKDKSFRRLTFDQDGNWNPTIMNNGRVMYTRWEYTDLTHYFSRIVMHMNPDGTENKALYGSGSFFPTSTFDVKPLPHHPSQFIGIISGHHGVVRSGRLLIFDPMKSRKEAEGVVQELPYRDRIVEPIIKDYLVDGVWPQFIRPCPLNEKYFLVSAKLTPESLWGVYLVDIYDNLTCIAEFEGEGFNSPIMVTKSPTPPIIPDRVNLKDKEATVFIQDIYEGEGTEDIKRGVVKELRVLAYEYAYWRSPSDYDVQGIQSGWDIKRILGTVPVEEDGSVIFKVPANTPIAIQPLDSEGRAVQWMRSWFTPMPGETVSCIGCHEDLNKIPMPKRTIASQRKPHALKAPEGGARPFTFKLEMQPILDRACIACHNEESDRNFKHEMDTKYPNYGGHSYSKSYLNIMPYIYRQGPEADMYVLESYEYHASNSELVRLLKIGHHGVELTEKEWRTLYNWIDFNAPYQGGFSRISKQNGFDQYERRIELANKYNNGAGVPWKKELEDYASYLKGKGEIKPVMPAKAKEVKRKEVKLSSWPFSKEEAKEMQNEKKDTRKTVEVAPGVKMNFVWIPAGKFVMGNNNAQADCAPEFKAEVKDGFWMSETEVTNEQYCALVPEHDSRVIGQFLKDHTTPGFWVNKPKQPVIRVSYDDVLKYCEMLGEKSGVTMLLPTETQWEWACRAGSDSDFWYGNSNTNFAKFENMADAQLSGIVPLAKNSSLRKYWDYLPKISSVDDGEMVTAFVGKYESNPWGLKDMHGNVSEWTRSDYVEYPLKLKEVAELKVARGGSWIDRPKYSASHSRKAFSPWQRVYNVGFRVIVAE